MGNTNHSDEQTACGNATTPIPSKADGLSRTPLKQRLLFLFSRLLPWAGKVLLTVMAVAVLLTSLKLALTAQSLLDFSRSQPPPPSFLSSSPHPSGGNDSVSVPWPEFPHSGPRRVRTSLINRVRTITDGWTTSAPVADVLAYYRDQMLSRGWRDVTEETYSLQPQRHQDLNSAGAELFAADYRKIMDSTLVLTSGQWTMHIVAAPSQRLPQNLVAIYAIEAPSLKEFSDALQATFAPNASKPLEALQQKGGQVYRTSISARDQPTAEAFRQELAALEAQGWHSLVVLPAQHGHPGQFSWLVKGGDYMGLSVSPLEGRNRCCVTLTQVAPDGAGSGH